ncbi:hypothetical protein LEP1GSC137_1690 [Leptospira borgpetersenii str. Noumea 25]|uniref:Uncharacterized protein n=1 Tax=Leptospira borgpetersenii serovar Ballum TaxID=280505 RepID=A0A0S2INU9_LEPBO|nr:hypothetical protein LBBP_00974 [Leptospira borgpetersenii serovar Ballum]EKQ98616.1 hypothetical protein LEP1GSC121_3304 [Leptospira borgpetersenii serovar Castellonis str. 200801910]EMO07833.1 hypothetical protein LEP1GSC137_1690 [Leptospira borgpetersenii str. Noumea 25]
MFEISSWRMSLFGFQRGWHFFDSFFRFLTDIFGSTIKVA